MSKVLIVGTHPVVDDVRRQYETAGWTVWCLTDAIADDVAMGEFDELFLTTEYVAEPNKAGHQKALAADYAVMALLGRLADGVDLEKRGGRKVRCHLLVNTVEVLRQLQTTDWNEDIRKRVDVYPFSMEEVWSRQVMLDHDPITVQSDTHAHLVIFGMSQMGEMVAITAAQMAHFPNYVRDHSLRTRITLVDEHAIGLSKSFISRYRHLFDNSFYRVVNPNEPDAVKEFHKPVYDGRREDFVDVEWEFVHAAVTDVALREKLTRWTHDERQQLTIVLAHDDDNRNVSETMLLPEAIGKLGVPVYVRTAYTRSFGHSPHIRPVGMVDQGYDVTLPLVRMAMNVNHVYDRCYADNYEDWNGQLRYAVEIDRQARDASWARLRNVKRMSSIYNAMNIPIKLRSIGLNEDEWDKFYDIPQQDIELLAQVEHNRWCVEELIMGWRPCTDEERQAIEADINKKEELKQRLIHYDLCAFSELKLDKTGKPVTIYDLCLCSCLPLITKAFADEKGGDAQP